MGKPFFWDKPISACQWSATKPDHTVLDQGAVSFPVPVSPKAHIRVYVFAFRRLPSWITASNHIKSARIWWLNASKTAEETFWLSARCILVCPWLSHVTRSHETFLQHTWCDSWFSDVNSAEFSPDQATGFASFADCFIDFSPGTRAEEQHFLHGRWVENQMSGGYMKLNEN